VVDKPIIQYAFEEARAAGIEQFIFVTGRGKSSIDDHFDHSYELDDTLEMKGKTAELASVAEWLPKPGQVSYTRQQKPLGLGHAVWCARDLVGDEPFAVLLVDELLQSDPPCLKEMVDLHKETRGNVVSVMEVPEDHTNRYGILEIGEDDGRTVEAKGMVEKPAPENAPSRLALIGRYVLMPEVFRHLDKQETGAGGEIQLTDAMEKMLGSAPFHGLRFQGQRYDCGSRLGYLEAIVANAMARPELRSGMTSILKRYL
ncbi:MAG: UTP--glucose-1-phosphate uridylyltransferase, partial [Geminicoccaceae bacterium]